MSEEKILTKALIDFISQISETQYCAGWMSGVEFDLWAIINKEKSIRWTWELNETEIETLKYFSKKINGWVRFPEEGKSPMFIPMELWKDIYNLERRLKK